MRFCIECKDKRICDKCNNQVNENKEIAVIIFLFNQKAASQFGHSLLNLKNRMVFL